MLTQVVLVILPNDHVVNLFDLAISHDRTGSGPWIEHGVAGIGSPLDCVRTVAVAATASVVVEAKESIGLVLPAGVSFIGIMKQRLRRER